MYILSIICYFSIMEIGFLVDQTNQNGLANLTDQSYCSSNVMPDTVSQSTEKKIANCCNNRAGLWLIDCNWLPLLKNPTTLAE